ncbi:MAG: hypothetical protein R2860_02060 [Desulfobacterales bacterium]
MNQNNNVGVRVGILFAFLSGKKSNKEAALQPIFPRPPGFMAIKNSLPFNHSKILSLLIPFAILAVIINLPCQTVAFSMKSDTAG